MNWTPPIWVVRPLQAGGVEHSRVQEPTSPAIVPATVSGLAKAVQRWRRFTSPLGDHCQIRERRALPNCLLRMIQGGRCLACCMLYLRIILFKALFFAVHGIDSKPLCATSPWQVIRPMSNWPECGLPEDCWKPVLHTLRYFSAVTFGACSAFDAISYSILAPCLYLVLYYTIEIMMIVQYMLVTSNLGCR